MVISRTPFRISFFGGGTDYPVWYRQHPGMVISTSINKYTYITCRYLPPFFKYKYRIRYTKQEYKKDISQIIHPSVRACLMHLKFNKNLEMQHNADLPAMSGLGSSSSFTVGLLNALYALKGRGVSKRKLALDAIHVEQDLIGENVGAQDQTIAAYGGFNKIVFGGKGTIKVSTLKIDDIKLAILQKNLLLLFTGFTRKASDIARLQIKNTSKKTRELFQMMDITNAAEKILTGKNGDIDDFGKLLNETWQLKKSLSNKISNSQIDDIYSVAIKNGALGGKLLGAGGGGFLLFYVKDGNKAKLLNSLKKLLYVPIKFETQGSQIIYKMPNDL